jgi:hypothetical protein
MRRPSERLLNCSSSGVSSHATTTTTSQLPTFCVRASPNPEFASNPGNFAHFWLAHLYPLAAALQSAGVSEHRAFRSTLLLFHGRNRVLPKWSKFYSQLLSGGAAGPSQCISRGVPIATDAERGATFGCTLGVRVSVATFQLINRTFYRPASVRYFARATRGALLGHWANSALGKAISSASLPARVVVLLRDGQRRVLGLSRACDRRGNGAATRLHAIDVVCVRPGRYEPLMVAARELGEPRTRAMVGGHGAGLSLLTFLPTSGCNLGEIDHIGNGARARNMYQYLASAAGHHPFKVWLDGEGARYCPHRVIACTSAAKGTTIHGCSVGYTSNVTLTEVLLHDVLRVAGDASRMSAGWSAARECSGVARDQERGAHWWNVNSELSRPFSL